VKLAPTAARWGSPQIGILLTSYVTNDRLGPHVALLAWAVMTRRMSPSGSTWGMDLPGAVSDVRIGLAPPGGPVSGVDPADVPLPSFTEGPQPAVPPSLPAGWYPDENDATLQRYYDGTAWTQHTALR